MNILLNDFVDWLQLPDNIVAPTTTTATAIASPVSPSSADSSPIGTSSEKGSESPSSPSQTTTATLAVASAVAAPSATNTYQYDNLIRLLDLFVTNAQTTFAMASSLLSSSSQSDIHQQDRQEEILTYYLPPFVLTQFVTLYLRKFDTTFDFHCPVNNCGSTCIFAIEYCPNEGCNVKYSRKWYTAHDIICPEKLLPCPRNCHGVCCDHNNKEGGANETEGETSNDIKLFGIKRKGMDEHLNNICSLRPVTCPYQCLGCHTGIFILLASTCFFSLFDNI